MTTYLVTSDRLNGLKRGDTVNINELTDHDVNVEALIEAGHISPQTVKKPAKTKTKENED